jgi:hypothetical protein
MAWGRRSSAASTAASHSDHSEICGWAGEPCGASASPPGIAACGPRCRRETKGCASRRRETLADTADADLLQAGPLLVEHGRIAFDPTADVEGFSAAADQFDSDIAAGRHPRAAIGVGDGHVTLLACDGRRSLVDDGLTMLELATAMRDVGCETAMNLDGGGSTTLVHRGHLLNRPYTEQDQPAPASRPIVSALLFHAA